MAHTTGATEFGLDGERKRDALHPLLARLLDFGSDALVSIWHGATDFYRSQNLTYAAAIAYFGLLSLFPFLMIVLSLLGTATANEADRATVLGFVLRYFPRHFDFITSQLDAFRTSRVPLGIAGSLLTIWASLGVFGAVTSGVNYAWGVERQPSYWRHKLIAFLMLAAASMLLLTALILVSARGVVEASWFAVVLNQTPGLALIGSVAAHWAATLLFILVVGLIFYFVPNTTVRFRDVWYGAVVTGLLWHGALQGFSWYVKDLSRFSIHGSIAAVVVFLFWVYISAVILLYGVEVTAGYAKLRRESERRYVRRTRQRASA